MQLGTYHSTVMYTRVPQTTGICKQMYLFSDLCMCTGMHMHSLQVPGPLALTWVPRAPPTDEMPGLLEQGDPRRWERLSGGGGGGVPRGSELSPLSNAGPGVSQPSQCRGTLLRPASLPTGPAGPTPHHHLCWPVYGRPWPWAGASEVGRAPCFRNGLPGEGECPSPPMHLFMTAVSIYRSWHGSRGQLTKSGL